MERGSKTTKMTMKKIQIWSKFNLISWLARVILLTRLKKTRKIKEEMIKRYQSKKKVFVRELLFYRGVFLCVYKCMVTTVQDG